MDALMIILYVLASLLILIVLFLIGYLIWDRNRPFPKSGKVIDKWYEEERTWVQIMPIIIGKIVSMIPIFHYDDEDWVITIEDEDGLKGDLYLSEAKWKKINIGDHFVVGDDSNTFDSIETEETDSDAKVQDEPEEKVTR